MADSSKDVSVTNDGVAGTTTPAPLWMPTLYTADDGPLNDEAMQWMKMRQGLVEQQEQTRKSDDAAKLAESEGSTYLNKSRIGNTANEPILADAHPTQDIGTGHVVGPVGSHRAEEVDEPRLSHIPEPTETSPSPLSNAHLESDSAPLGLHKVHAAKEPRMDIIFVHDLEGDSFNTWCHNGNRALFWPKEWLPQEDGLEHANIHTFGYASKWAAQRRSEFGIKNFRQVFLDIEDFGHVFFATLEQDPNLCQSHEAPILLVAHGLGGYIIIKTFILAKTQSSELGSRIQGLFFLATPFYSSPRVRLWNETSPADGNAGGSIGPKGLFAKLKERQKQLDLYAHEVSIYSFEGDALAQRSDSSASNGFSQKLGGWLYHALGGSAQFHDRTHRDYSQLATAIQSEITYLDSEKFSYPLATSDSLDGQYTYLNMVLRVLAPNKGPPLPRPMDGTAEWIYDRQDFNNWLEVENQDPLLYWIEGRPGTGKTCLVSRIISRLQANDSCCVYYSRDDSKPQGWSADHTLRSLANELAGKHAEFGINLSAWAIRTISRQKIGLSTDFLFEDIFLGQIGKIKSKVPQYWILDGMDDSGDHASLMRFLSPILSGSCKLAFSLRILITSRTSSAITTRMKELHSQAIFYITMPREEVTNDIATYTIAAIPDPKLYHVAWPFIVQFADCNFLWTSLALRNLAKAYPSTTKQVESTLQRLPVEMSQFYSAIIRSMAFRDGYGLARKLVGWIVCAARPMTVAEFRGVVKLRFSVLPDQFELVLDIFCGLVYVDDAGLISLSHFTVRQFFFTAEAKRFRVDELYVHREIVERCLDLLTSEPFLNSTLSDDTHTWNRRLLPPSYGFENFAYHLQRALPIHEQTRAQLSIFLEQGIVLWIEQRARVRSQSYLSQLAETLLAVADSEEQSPSSVRFSQRLRHWASDLLEIDECRLELAHDPSDIHILIPVHVLDDDLRRRQSIREHIKTLKSRNHFPKKRYRVEEDAEFDSFVVEGGPSGSDWGDNEVDLESCGGDSDADSHVRSAEPDLVASARDPNTQSNSQLDQAVSRQMLHDESEDEIDETDSATNPSYAQSVFSQRTRLSTALSQSLGESLLSAKDEIVELLLDDVDLKKLFNMAVMDPQIGPDKLARNFGRLLVAYSTDLWQMTDVKVYRETAKLVGGSASYISDRIRWTVDPTQGKLPDLNPDESAGKRQVLNQFLETLWDPAPKQSNKIVLLDAVNDPVEPGPSLNAETPVAPKSATSVASVESDGEILKLLDQVKSFLKEGPPFENLKNGLRSFVVPRLADTNRTAPPKEKDKDNAQEADDDKQVTGDISAPTPVALSERTGWKWNNSLSSLPALADSLLWFTPDSLGEPALPEGLKRVRWECVCGSRLYDDFLEIEPGSVQRLEKTLQTACSDSNGIPAGGQSTSESAITFLSAVGSSFNKIGKSLRGKAIRGPAPLPMHNPPVNGQPIAKARGPVSHLLYCIRNDETGLKLYQERIEDVSTDYELMLFLRERYRLFRKPFSWLRMRHVSQVYFNRFEVDASHFAQVHNHDKSCLGDCVCIPPLASINTEYLCHPAPQQKPPHVPIFGENYLIHYFRNPECLSKTQSRIFHQLPKRICGRLAPPDDQSSHGWGVYFEEGWHRRSVYLVVAGLFVTGSLVFGILWSVFKKSIQDAFAISGCWMTLGAILLGWAAVRSF